MGRQLTIVHLITELNFGGAEQLLVNTLLHNRESRFRYKVVTLYAGDTPLAERLRQGDIPVHDLQLKSAGRLGRLWRFYRWLRRERPAILQGWLIHAILLARLLGRLAGVPIIVSARHSLNLGGRGREWLNRLTGRLNDRTIAICELMRRVEMERAGTPPEKIVTIYNGIAPPDLPPRGPARAALRQRLQLPADALLIGTVARLHPAKGHAAYAPAIRQVVERVPEAHFVWIGDGQERASLEGRVEQLGLAAHVHFVGSQEDVSAWLAGMDVFVLPSLWEGLSVALLEAIAAGLPVVATAVGGTPEVVVEGVTGLLVPPGEPEALAGAILTLLDNLPEAIEMGRAGQERVAALFTLERMVQQTEALYSGLTEEKLSLYYVPGRGWQPMSTSPG